MSATTPLPDNPQNDRQLTLGDLLYPDPARPRISEAAWLALVQAIAGQDASALKVLYGLSHRLVFTLALRLVGNRATAEDVTLEVFHEIWRRAGAYDPAADTVVGWIMNLARARSLDRLRAGRPEDAARLRAAMAALTADERAAIEMVYFSDSTYAEVSQRLGLPMGTISARIRTGMAKLRFALAGDGVP